MTTISLQKEQIQIVLSISAKNLQDIWDKFSDQWKTKNENISKLEALGFIREIQNEWYLNIYPHLENEDVDVQNLVQFYNDLAFSMIDYLEKYIPSSSQKDITELKIVLKNLIHKSFVNKKNLKDKEAVKAFEELQKEVKNLMQEVDLASHSKDIQIKKETLELQTKIKELIHGKNSK